MNVIVSDAAEIALRTLGDEDRRKVFAWFGYLRNWESDPFVQSRSRKVQTTGAEDLRVLRTSTDLRIFFVLHPQQIEVVDIARRETLEIVGRASQPART